MHTHRPSRISQREFMAKVTEAVNADVQEFDGPGPEVLEAGLMRRGLAKSRRAAFELVFRVLSKTPCPKFEVVDFDKIPR